MSKIAVSTPFNIELEFSLASIPKRAAAYFIDLLICSSYLYLVILTIFQNIETPKLLELGGMLFILIPVYFYHPLSEILMNGQSIGKKIMGIRVINEKGNAASISQYLLRWILSILNYASVAIAYYLFAIPPIIFFLFMLALPDVISIATSTTGKRIGDRAAGTVVVNTKTVMPISNTIFIEQRENTNYTPKFPEVMQLTDRDINSLRNLLAQKRSRHLDEYVTPIAERIEKALGVHNNSGDPYYFFEELLFDYNYLTQQKTNS